MSVMYLSGSGPRIWAWSLRLSERSSAACDTRHPAPKSVRKSVHRSERISGGSCASSILTGITRRCPRSVRPLGSERRRSTQEIVTTRGHPTLVRMVRPLELWPNGGGNASSRIASRSDYVGAEARTRRETLRRTPDPRRCQVHRARGEHLRAGPSRRRRSCVARRTSRAVLGGRMERKATQNPCG